MALLAAVFSWLLQAASPAPPSTGVTGQSSAGAIDVAAGTEAGGIDVTLTRQPVFRVRGLLPPDDTDLTPDLIWLVSKDRVPGGAHHEGDITNRRFEFRKVPPGSYWVRAHAGEVPLLGGEIDVVDADVDDVVLTAHRGFSFKGHVRREGAPWSATWDREWARVTLEPIDDSLAEERSAVIEPAGSMRFRSVLPGDYRLRATGLPPGVGIKSARLGGIDVLNGLSIGGPVKASLEIVLSTGTRRIEAASSIRPPGH